MKKKLTMLLALLILLPAAVPAAHAQELPDPSRSGSITFRMEWDGKPLDGGSLTLYRVGDIAEENGDYKFVPVDALQNSGVELDHLDDPALAQDLARLTPDQALEPISAPITGGRIIFPDLAPGLYVVTQKAQDTTEGFYPIQPFLISLPQWKNGAYVYDLEGWPKQSPVPEATLPPEPTEPSTPTESYPTEPEEPTEPEPSEPGLPNTGQLNWPVPLLSVSGLALFAFGWFLCFGKRGSREK